MPRTWTRISISCCFPLGCYPCVLDLGVSLLTLLLVLQLITVPLVVDVYVGSTIFIATCNVFSCVQRWFPWVVRAGYDAPDDCSAWCLPEYPSVEVAFVFCLVAVKFSFHDIRKFLMYMSMVYCSSIDRKRDMFYCGLLHSVILLEKSQRAMWCPLLADRGSAGAAASPIFGGVLGGCVWTRSVQGDDIPIQLG